MKLRLSLLAAAVATIAVPAFAAPTLEVYGKVNIDLQYSKEEGKDDPTLGRQYGKDNWELRSNASRFGVKGELPIADDFVGIYQLEWEIDTTDVSNVKQDSSNKNTDFQIKARNQIVGLKGAFGKTFVGRYDTPSKLVMTKVDLFNDLSPEAKVLFGGKNRANNIAQYSTPSLGGFTLNVATMLQEKTDNDPAVKTDDQNGLFDATSISGEFTTGGFWVGVSVENNQDLNGAYLDGAQITRLSSQFKMGDWTFGGMYQKYKESEWPNKGQVVAPGTFPKGDLNQDGKLNSPTGFMLNTSVTVAENHVFKLQIGQSDVTADAGSATKYTLNGSQHTFGYDYKMAKNVKLFAFTSNKSNDIILTLSNGSTATVKEARDSSYTGVGLELNF